MNDFLLGLVTTPAVAAAGVGLIYGGRKFAAFTVKACRGLTPGSAYKRSLFAAACASANRVHTLGFGGFTLSLAVGHNPVQAKAIYDAVYKTIGPAPATVNPRRRRPVPADPGVDFDEGDSAGG